MRDKQIDFLRFLGISLIVLAHVYPPNWIFQLRNFDVPLIVLVSGMSLKQTSIQENYAAYVWKRIKRLVFPLWIFLTVYFLFIWVTGIKFVALTFENIAGSYLLIKGIGGFLWIIRVFLLVALASPFILEVSKNIKSNRAYLFLLLLTYVAYELFFHLTSPFLKGVGGEIVSYLVYFGIAYSLVFALGIRLNQLTSKEVFLVGLFSLIGFIILLCIYYFREKHFVPTQEYKFPPTAYYLSYGISASILAWKITKKFDKYWGKFGGAKDVVMFIAQNSLWIYLWHILFLSIVSRIPVKIFLLKYIFVYSGAVLITFFQVMFVQKWLLSSIQNESIRKNLKIILTG